MLAQSSANGGRLGAAPRRGGGKRGRIIMPRSSRLLLTVNLRNVKAGSKSTYIALLISAVTKRCTLL
jgi:hypothetical protein